MGQAKREQETFEWVALFFSVCRLVTDKGICL